MTARFGASAPRFARLNLRSCRAPHSQPSQVHTKSFSGSEAASYFDLDLDEFNIVTGNLRFRVGAINIAVINTAAKLAERIASHKCFLVVDECHKAASEHFRAALSVNSSASLGLSATPERPYDEGLQDVLIPALGPVIFSYDYAAALRDGVIVPFELRNIVFDLDEDRQAEYDKLSKAIARSISKFGPEAEETIALFLKRARVLNLSSGLSWEPAAVAVSSLAARWSMAPDRSAASGATIPYPGRATASIPGRHAGVAGWGAWRPGCRDRA